MKMHWKYSSAQKWHKGNICCQNGKNTHAYTFIQKNARPTRHNTTQHCYDKKWLSFCCTAFATSVLICQYLFLLTMRYFIETVYLACLLAGIVVFRMLYACWFFFLLCAASLFPSCNYDYVIPLTVSLSFY